jgi:hypothetical protein
MNLADVIVRSFFRALAWRAAAGFSPTAAAVTLLIVLVLLALAG